METIKQEKVINLNLNLKLGELREHNWARVAVFIFAITPFIFSFGFKRIPFYMDLNFWQIIVASMLMQIPILIIGIPLYILYIKNKYPEKISERRFEFRVSDFQLSHYFMASFWLSGVFGTISFLICLIFNFTQGCFLLILYGYMLLRLLASIFLWLYKNKV